MPYSHYQYPYSHYQYPYSHYQYPYSHYEYPYSHYEYPYSHYEYGGRYATDATADAPRRTDGQRVNLSSGPQGQRGGQRGGNAAATRWTNRVEGTPAASRAGRGSLPLRHGNGAGFVAK